MTCRIGNTTYRVKVFTSQTATESFEDKVLRLVRSDHSLFEMEKSDDETEK